MNLTPVCRWKVIGTKQDGALQHFNLVTTREFDGGRVAFGLGKWSTIAPETGWGIPSNSTFCIVFIGYRSRLLYRYTSNGYISLSQAQRSNLLAGRALSNLLAGRSGKVGPNSTHQIHSGIICNSTPADGWCADDQQARHLDLVTTREERKFTLRDGPTSKPTCSKRFAGKTN